MARQFYLIRRKDKLTRDPGGKLKPTFYCRFRSPDGSLQAWRSTGLVARSAAEAWAVHQIKRGREGVRRSLSFKGYASDWWTRNHAYVQGRIARGRHLTATYLVVMRGHLVNHVLPHFQDMRLEAITPRHVEEWLLALRREKLSSATINHALRCLKTILKEAARQEVIARDPSQAITGLSERPAERGILTGVEMRKLLDERRIATVWVGDRMHFTLSLTAVSTGLRMGELQALAVAAVREDHLLVSQSWERREGLKAGTKTGPGRIVPLPSITARHLHALISSSPYQESADLVFYGADRSTPLAPKVIMRAFYAALDAIGITAEEREKRRISFHSHRHFLNTTLRAARIPDPLVQRVTGHRTQEMTEHYSHFALEDFGEVMKVQERLFG